MQFLTIISLFLLAFALSSCGRYIYYDRVLSPEIDHIGLVSVHFKNDTEKEIQRVHYPSSSFMLTHFSDGLKEEFNKNTNEVRLSYWNDSESQNKLLNHEKFIKRLHLSQPVYLLSTSSKDSILAINGTSWKRVSRYKKQFPGNYYLSLELSMTAWEQNVKGFFKLRNKRGKIIWREELDHQSPYIHNDPDSPYRSKNYRIPQLAIDSESDHYQEMEKTFYELGKSVAISLKETLAKIKTLNN